MEKHIFRTSEKLGSRIMFKKPIQIGNKKDLGRKGSLGVIEAIKDPALRSESLV